MKPFLSMVALVALLHSVNFIGAQDPGKPGKADPAQKDAQPPKTGKAKAALVLNDPKAFQGYTFFSPMNASKSYLIDMQGRVVHIWQAAGNPALAGYLQADGSVFRPTSAGNKGKSIAGGGNRLQEIAWDGTVVWDYQLGNDQQTAHHDAIKLPNGNVLAIVSRTKTAAETSAAGRKDGSGMMADTLLEIKPRGKDGGDIVWQWNAWDHRVQDADPAKPNFGKLAEHPELIDVNYAGGFGKGGGGKGKDGPGKGKDDKKFDPKGADPKGFDPKKDFVAQPGKGGKGGGGLDWNHANGLSYNPELDQILISVHSFCEFWIIDHSTTTAEAASNKGGKQGKGGDLLYRWGNPRAYGAGTANDQQLFFQHNAHFIPAGLPGGGHVLVFNNGTNRPGTAYSAVEEIVTPVTATGGYTHKPGTAYGPAKSVWSYTAENKGDFHAFNLSGAQRLPNGHTLICSGNAAIIFEVTPAKEVVWKYETPGGGGKGPGGGFGDKKGDGKKGDAKEFDAKGFDQKQDFVLQPGGKGGPGGGGVSLYRAYRFAPDHPAFAGKTLTPGSTLEELLLKDSKGK